jgi:hypothetical protein
MDELKWKLLTEVSGRLQADMIKSHLEAEGIEVELFQEAVGHHVYPVMVDGLGRVQLFVPKSKAVEARKILAVYEKSTGQES